MNEKTKLPCEFAFAIALFMRFILIGSYLFLWLSCVLKYNETRKHNSHQNNKTNFQVHNKTKQNFLGMHYCLLVVVLNKQNK